MRTRWLAARPAREGEQQQQPQPDDERAPQQVQRALQVIRIWDCALAQIGAEIDTRFERQRAAQTHTQRTSAAREQDPLRRVNPRGRMTAPGRDGLLEIPGDGEADRRQPYRQPVEDAERARGETPEGTELLVAAPTSISASEEIS